MDEADPGLPVKPSFTALDKQWVTFGKPCGEDLAPGAGPLSDKCVQTELAQKPKKTVVVVGDSHAQQFSGALNELAKKNNWEVVALLLGGCDFGAEDTPSGRSDKCADFNEAAMSYILKHSPDAVFTMATKSVADSPSEGIPTGYESAVRTIAGAGIDVIGIRDNPRFVGNMASCVAKSGAEDCAVQQSEHLAASNPSESLNRIDGAHMIDLTDQLCKDGVCNPVVGNILVYLDQNHLTWDYVKTMAPALGQRIAESTGWDVK